MPDSKRIHVSDLRLGMYVTKLDKDWLDTPFLMQGFYIEEPDDINVVAEYCEYVWVDSHERDSYSKQSSGVGTASFAPVKTIEYTSPVLEEHRRVFKTFNRARNITKSLLDDIRLGGALDAGQAKETVDACVQSVLRHPDALLWMSRIREESEYTSEHCLNVCILAITFGRHLGFDAQDLEKIGLCGLLHDVGKMRVPHDILNKPGKLDDKEYSLMKSHTVHGRNLLLAANSIYSGAIDVAYSHHEKVDGTGYPRKISAAGISKFAKIIAIVDAYDAMTANRCYSRAVTSTEALKRIYKDRGKHFDEILAIQFIKAIGLFPSGSIVELYNGEIGIVIETNQKRRHLPKVILVRNSNKEPRTKETIVDLSLVESGEVSKQYLIKKVWPDGTFGVSLRDYQKKGLVLKM